MTIGRKTFSDFLTTLRDTARGLWTPDGTISEKAVRATVWNFAAMLARRGLRVVQLMVMARLLDPKDFGTLAICGVVIEFFELLTDLGLNLPIIQRKDVDDNVLNTAWTMSLCRNLLLFLVTIGVSGSIASFYGDPLLSPVMRVLALRFLISAFGNIGTTLWQRDMNFRRDQLCNIAIWTTSVGATIVMGVLMRSVWALVYGQILQAVISVVASYLLHPYRPRLRWRWEHVREFVHFGLNITASGVVFHLATTSDQLVLGKVADEKRLGYYSLALALSNLPAVWIANTLRYAAMPTYAKFQNDRERLGRSFAAVVKCVLILTVPATAGMWLLAPGVLHLAYGAKYLPAVSCFRVLALFALITGLGETVLPLFLAVGRPRLHLLFHTIHLALLGSIVYPMVLYGDLVGAAWSQLIAVAGSCLWAVWAVRKIVGTEALGDAWDCFKGVAVSAFIMSAVVALMILGRMTANVPGLALAVAIGAGVYAAMLYVISPGTIQEVRRITAKVRAPAFAEPADGKPAVAGAAAGKQGAA